MIKAKRLHDVRKLMRRHGAAQLPSIDLFEPEVRSDMVWPPTKSGSVSDIAEADSRKYRKQSRLGVFIVEWGYDVERISDFHTWLANNEVKLARSCPEGVAYKGTFAALFGPMDRRDGRYRTFWAVDSLNNLMLFAVDPSKDRKHREFGRLLQELLSYRDKRKASGFSQLYQVAAGTPLYGEEGSRERATRTAPAARAARRRGRR